MKYTRYLVPIVMAIVAAHQLYRVQVEDLVSWRGGGFGMYGSFHPRQHEIWVTHTDGRRQKFTKYDDDDTDLFRTVRSLLTWPNQARVDAAFVASNEDKVAIEDLEVYRLAFDPKSGVLSRKLLVSAPQTAQPAGEVTDD